MKIAQCGHLPEEFAKARKDVCEGGDPSINLRVCLECGHVGCCDSSPGRHARKHAQETGHQVMASYPLSKESFIWCYKDNDYLEADSEHNLE